MDLEADRMRNLRFDTNLVDSERRVVEAERRSRSESDNLGFLYERLNSTAFVAHPYRWPVDGSPTRVHGPLKSFRITIAGATRPTTACS